MRLPKFKFKKPKRPKLTLHSVNTGLLVLILLINAYVILAPLFPAVAFWWQDHHTDRRQQLTSQLHHPSSTGTTTPASKQGNRVVIPSMLLDTPVREGPVAQQYAILDKGVWRWPAGSTPDKGGNTILIGHRFTYTNPRGIFYYLNKVAIGNEIGVFWHNKEYLYRVATIKVVPPTDVAIETPTKDARLTLFTCTPLWLPKNRLVVVAELETKS